MKLLPGQMVIPLLALIITSQCLWLVISDDCGGKEIANTITVGQTGQFKTVQSAIDSIKSNNDRWVKILISPGTYTEKVQIPIDKPCILLEGQGRSVTTITFGDHEQTDTSATFTSSPNNIVATGINFQNSFDISANEVKPALAARIYGDKSAFFDCGFLGFQDTLWDAEGRHYFKNCYIQGVVDFIFGNGQSYYENCDMNVTLTTSKAQVSLGYITAQARHSDKDSDGFVFSGGRITGSGTPVYLGRAYGPYSRVIFNGTFLDSSISPLGWDAWDYKQHEENLMYAEVNCGGPGANQGQRVPWEAKLSSSQLNQFSISSFINQDGWLANIPA